MGTPEIETLKNILLTIKLQGEVMFLNHFRNKRVLITGHTGFKGSWLTLWLNNLNAKVSGYSKDIPTNPSLFESLNLQQNIEHNFGDILDYDSLINVFEKFKPEIVFHLAAQPIVSESIKNPINTYRTNIIGSANVRMYKKYKKYTDCSYDYK